MAVTKRANGRWQAKIRGLDGVAWWSLTCDTKREAERAEREMREAVTQGQEWRHPRRRDRSHQVTIEAAGIAFLQAHAHLWRPGTIRLYGSYLEQFNGWALAERLTLAQLDDTVILRWRASLALRRDGAPRAERGLNDAATVIIQLWRWTAEEAPRRGWAVPAWRRVRLKKTAPPRPTTAPTWAEMDRFIDQLRPIGKRGSRARYRLAVVQRFTGARIGEVFALRWADVDLDAALVTFRPETTKGGYSGRTVPISPHLLAEIQTWARDDVRLCGPSGKAGGGAIVINAWQRAGVREAAWAGQTSHALRKGVVTGLLRLGAAPDAVEALIGHKMDAVRAAYVDLAHAFDLRAVVALIPPLSVPLKGV